jgi:endonuclease/exonuclease/phosphatase family metal-dependent hydrolase
MMGTDRRPPFLGLVLGLALTWAGAGSGMASEPPGSLRFVTLNLFHGGVASGWTGRDHDLERRLDLVTGQLRALAPDVVALQEASRNRRRGNVAERLARRLGLHHVYTPALTGPLGWLLNLEVGLAILSRFPIVGVERHPLAGCRRPFDPRVLLAAELETPWGRLPAFSVHTSNDVCHAREVAERVRSRRGPLPGVLMGDFNAVEESLPIRALTDEGGFVDAFRRANPAVAGSTVWQRVEVFQATVRRRVDFVFLVPGTAVAGRVLRSMVVLDTPRTTPDGRPLWASDHYGVLADLAVFPAPALATTPAGLAP